MSNSKVKQVVSSKAERPEVEDEVEHETDAPSSPPSGKKKRKAVEINEEDVLEIDVNLPEPPSKKAKRLEKKKKESKDKKPAEVSEAAKAIAKEYSHGDAAVPTTGYAGTGAAAQKRSDYGIWIGNLPFSATKETLRVFLKDHGGIEGDDVVRVHMPAPVPDRNDNRVKSQNKGFAYVDFTTEAVQNVAIGLSEKLMTGRRVLIKNSKSFEGRPQKSAEDVAASTAKVGPGGKEKKEPAKRVFVGNLGFDVTQEDLSEHFSIAGEIEDIHMATFEDSGKCKGFAWVRFKEVEAAEAAVRGFVYRKADGDTDSESDDAEVIEDAADAGSSRKKKSKAKSRRHKQHIDQLHGRDLRREFAEDSQTRYKKRYGKEAAKPRAEDYGDRRATKPAATAAAPAGNGEETLEDLVQQAASARDFKGPKPRAQKRDADQRRDERRKKHEDARNIAPGKALASAQRSTGAIVAGAGKRQTFD